VLAYAFVRDYGFEYLLLSAMAVVFSVVGGASLFRAVKRHEVGGILFSIIWLGGSLFVFGMFLADIPGGIGGLLFSPLGAIAGVVALIGYFYRRIGLLTPKGEAMHRYLLGYKEFMHKVEKDRIRRFLKQDPRYLDRGLPYAVLFGLHDHWIGFYDALQVDTPVWYRGDMHRIDDFADTFESQTHPPASESGGFGGGGSFSGGGGGGGGGGSW
jgi:uncharacterized membrane protein YgcG